MKIKQLHIHFNKKIFEPQFRYCPSQFFPCTVQFIIYYIHTIYTMYMPNVYASCGELNGSDTYCLILTTNCSPKDILTKFRYYT